MGHRIRSHGRRMEAGLAGPISASGRRVCRVGSRLEERPLARIRGHKYTKRLGVSALGQHVQTALAEDALRHWLAAQRQSDAPYIELA